MSLDVFGFLLLPLSLQFHLAQLARFRCECSLNRSLKKITSILGCVPSLLIVGCFYVRPIELVEVVWPVLIFDRGLLRVVIPVPR